MMLIRSSARRTGLFLQTCLLTLPLLMPGPATAEIHKWIDESGKTHYTQFPPQGRESEIVREAPSPAVTPAPPASVPPAEPPPEPEIEEKNKQGETAVTEQKREIEDIRQLNCDAATRNLATLKDKSQRRYMTAEGEMLRPTDAERQALSDQAKQQIKDNCSE